LQNIGKYADAKNVKLAMSSTEKGIAVSIIDDGIGFDTLKAKSGIGLKNMKSRVADLNGQFEVVSLPNNGTKINFSIPI
jgi:signal transduction histidine kinase